MGISVKMRRASARSVRTKLNADPLSQLGNTAKNACPAEIKEEGIERGRRPAQSQTFTWHEAFNIQSPSRAAANETQRAARNHDLSRPAILGALSSGIPDAVPIKKHAPSFGDKSLIPRPRRIDLKEVASAAVAICIEHDGNCVVAGEIAISLHSMYGDPRRSRIVAAKAKVHTIFVDDHAYLGIERRWSSRIGRLLYQVQHRSLLPSRFIESSVKDDWTGDRFGRYREVIAKAEGSCGEKNREEGTTLPCGAVGVALAIAEQSIKS